MKTNKLMGLLVLVVAVLLTAGLVLGAAPTGANKTVTTTEDTAYKFAVEDFGFDDEEDEDTFTSVKITELEENGVLQLDGVDVVLNQEIPVEDITAEDLVFTPALDENGLAYDSFTFTVIDNGEEDNESVEYTMTIDVTAVNDAPKITAIADNQEVLEGLEFYLSITASDVEGSDLVINMGASALDGVSFDELPATTWLTVDAAGLTLSGTPPARDDYEFSIVVVETAADGLSSAAETFTLTVEPIFATSLDINDDGKSGKLLIGEDNEIIVEVQNQYTKTLENIEVTIEIDDLDVDESEDLDEDELKSGRSEDVTFVFDINPDDVDEKEYEIIITVEGEDADGNTFQTVETRMIDMDIERHKVIITKVTAEPNYLQCNQGLTVQVTVENIGSNDEDEVEIRITNTKLGIEEVKSDIELDDFSGRDNDYRAMFQIDLDDETLAGDYILKIEVFLDGDLQESEEITITVEGCDLSLVEKGDGLVITDQFIQELREQLEAELTAKMAGENSLEPVKTTEDFRGSDTYVALLAILMVLLLIGVLLGLVTLIVKKKA